MRIRRAAQLVVEIDVRDFAVELVFSADRAPAAAGRDLQVKAADQVSILPRRPALHKEGRCLQFVCRGREARDGSARHPDD